MMLFLPETVSGEIYIKSYFEANLTRALISFVRKDDVFVDIGAHYGYFSLLATELVGKGGQVHSFEPSLSNYLILQENVKQNNQVWLNQLAVFSEETQLFMKDFGIALSAWNTIKDIKMNAEFAEQIKVFQKEFLVFTCTIDSYFRNKDRKPNFIKIDAESSEIEVLKGMTNTLTYAKPIITLEVGDTDGSDASKQCIEFMSKFDYIAYEFYEDGKMIVHTPHSGGYKYDNLIFLPSEA